jgi:DNA-binding CsgD family transcriptional regulator
VTSRPGPELEALIGEDALIRLAEAFGGTRLYVPVTISAAHDIARAIGVEAARRLSERLAPDVVRVPLAREQRARHYRAAGKSNAQIARALGITESGVDKLFARRRARGDDRQPSLFGD